MKKTLQSGALLEMSRTFQVSHRLFKTVLRELKTVNLKLGLSGEQAFGSIFEMKVNDETINTVKDAFAQILSSDAVEEILWECLERCLYNNKKITKDIFEDERVAEDYLEIMKEVGLFYLTPFQKSLVSLFFQVRPNEGSKGQSST